ncbi:MAG: O-antigen ligase family protein [Planctomycetaceae bacterium]
MPGFASSIQAPSSRRHVRTETHDTVKHGVSLPDRVIDLCLAVSLLVVPFTMAGIRETGSAIFIACSLVAGLTWAVRQIQWPESVSRASGAEIIVVLALVLVIAQMLKLPESLLRILSPFQEAYLASWGTESSQLFAADPWNTISLTPSLTRSGLVLLGAYSVFFLTLLQRLRNDHDIDRLLRIIAFSATVMALVGVGQLFFGNGRFLWMFEHPSRDTSWPAKGTFSNQNHFGHFLALGIGPLIWLWQCGRAPEKKQRSSSTRRHTTQTELTLSEPTQKLVLPAMAVVSLAAILSFSRGGIAAFLIATVVALSVYRDQLQSILKLFVPVAVFAVLGVLAFGTDALEHKWQSITQASSLEDLSKGRFALWNALAEAIPHFWRMGSGVGSHAEVYPTWLSENFAVRFSHAESGYLQILVETGLPGLTLVAAAVLLCCFWFTQIHRHADERAGKRATVIFAGLLVSFLHSTVDFVWYIPGCLIVTLTLAAALCRCYQLCVLKNVERDRATLLVPSRWPTVLAWLLVLIMVPLGKLSADVAYKGAASEADWSSFRKLSIDSSRQTSYESVDAIDENLDQMIPHLETCVRINSADGRAASRLAAMYLRRFERNQRDADNQMSVREIKNTVETAGFASRREIAEWLQRAFGSQSGDLYRALLMARQAVRSQPLRGDLYLLISQLGFLVQQSADAEAALVDQALRLRPHDAGVLFVAGVSLTERGDLDGGCEYFQKAFSADAAIRPMIVHNLAAHFSAQDFIQKIQPDDDGLWLLFQEYGRLKKADMQLAVAEHYQASFQELAEGSTRHRAFWTRSHQIFSHLKHPDQAIYCLKRAVDLDSTNYALRRSLASELMNNQQDAACREQLEWCQLRNPEDAIVAEMLKKLTARSWTEESHAER